MQTKCPKCHYIRQPSDTAPDYECPQCGVIYSKVTTPPAPKTETQQPELSPTQSRSKGADEKFCSECGEIIKAKAEICPKCGVRQMAPPSEKKPVQKDKFVAGLLALFLGGIGIHKFYLERSAQGTIYLLLCWTLIPALIALVEGLNYLTMTREVFDARYNQGTP